MSGYDRELGMGSSFSDRGYGSFYEDGGLSNPLSVDYASQRLSDDLSLLSNEVSLQRRGAMPVQRRGAMPAQRRSAMPAQRRGAMPVQRRSALPLQEYDATSLPSHQYDATSLPSHQYDTAPLPSHQYDATPLPSPPLSLSRSTQSSLRISSPFSHPSQPVSPHLSQLLPQCTQPHETTVAAWLDLLRSQLESGDYAEAHAAAEAALEAFPRSEVLLQKRLRIEEKMCHSRHAYETVRALFEVTSAKSVKILVEGITTLAKMGMEQEALGMYETIQACPRYHTGNYVYEMVKVEYLLGCRSSLITMLLLVLRDYAKHGPLWFFAFDFFEYDHLVFWNHESLLSVFENPCLDSLMQQAETVLSDDILWKLLSNRIQYYFRCMLYLQKAATLDGGSFQDLIKSYRILMDCISTDIRKAVAKCPPQLTWKLHLQFGRYSAVVGMRRFARQVSVAFFWHVVHSAFASPSAIQVASSCSAGVWEAGVSEWSLCGVGRDSRVQLHAVSERVEVAARAHSPLGRSCRV